MCGGRRCGCGTVCVCATVLQKGTKAPQAGGKIHTDFEKGFIMAEVREGEREGGRRREGRREEGGRERREGGRGERERIGWIEGGSVGT